MPGGTGSRLKGDAGTGNQGWVGRLKEGVDAYGAGKQVAGPLPEGWEPMRLISMTTF